VPVPPGTEKFDFQVLGVHLKAMAEGTPQRKESAAILANWLTTTAQATDSDTMILGDWNAAPDAPEWAPFHALEDDPATPVHFRDINDPSDYSYLWLANRSNRFLSRIDLAAVTLASANQVVDQQIAKVVQWVPIQEALARAGSMKDKAVVKVLQEVKEAVSDHLPTLARFYIKQK